MTRRERLDYSYGPRKSISGVALFAIVLGILVVVKLLVTLVGGH